MKFLIVGLGNVGAEYDNTRHNIGFKIVDSLLETQGGEPFELDRLAYKATIKYKGRTLILIKPTTFMNLSGKAVSYWMKAEKISLDHLLIVADDLALPFGKTRIKAKGGAGGHNGLKDIEATLHNSEYARLRFGVGNNFSRGKQIYYVLGKWNEDEEKEMEKSIKKAVDTILSFTTIGIERTMNFFN